MPASRGLNVKGPNDHNERPPISSASKVLKPLPMSTVYALGLKGPRSCPEGPQASEPGRFASPRGCACVLRAFLQNPEWKSRIPSLRKAAFLSPPQARPIAWTASGSAREAALLLRWPMPQPFPCPVGPPRHPSLDTLPKGRKTFSPPSAFSFHSASASGLGEHEPQECAAVVLWG